MKIILKLIGIVLLTFTFAFTGENSRTIVLDIGHGDKDLGAQFEEINEKDVVFSIAKNIRQLHQSESIKIVLTRNGDNFLSLEERTNMINELNPEYVISLHANLHYNENKSGTEIYISKNNKENAKSQQLAKKLANSLGEETTEIKNANFHILRNVNCPSALVELGFLSNEKDRKTLTSKEGQLEIASKIVSAINNY